MRFCDKALDRRKFLEAAAAGAAWAVGGGATAAQEGATAIPICAFDKYLKQLSHGELAQVIAELGFAGIEATVRKNGRVPPERVEDELPKLAEALGEHDLKITIMTTDIRRADDPLAPRVLKVASELGIKRYRMGYFHYDLSRPIWPQVKDLRPVFAELADLNRQQGIRGLYQNHSGERYFGGTLWDLHHVLRDVSPSQLGVAFDIRHAMVEAGRSWEVIYRLVRPHLGAVYAKDFRWQGRRDEHAPLGASVDPRFFKLLKQGGYSQPISLHVEYAPRAGLEENVQALRRDLAVLRRWLAA